MPGKHVPGTWYLLVRTFALLFCCLYYVLVIGSRVPCGTPNGRPVPLECVDSSGSIVFSLDKGSTLKNNMSGTPGSDVKTASWFGRSIYSSIADVYSSRIPLLLATGTTDCVYSWYLVRTYVGAYCCKQYRYLRRSGTNADHRTSCAHNGRKPSSCITPCIVSS